MGNGLRYLIGIAILFGVCLQRHSAVLANEYAAQPTPTQWNVIFRADNPRLWDRDAGDPSLPNGYSTRLKDAPPNIKYLMLRRMHSGDAIIIEMDRADLGRDATMDPLVLWEGGAPVKGKGGNPNKNKLLGVALQSHPSTSQQDQIVSREPGEDDKGYRGWGFSKAAAPDPTQTYSWNGMLIDKTVFEISVKENDLTPAEKKRLVAASTTH